MRKIATLAAGVLALAVIAGTTLALAEDDDDDEDEVLGRVVQTAPVTLEQGFSASMREGVPISAKFEIEVDGAQLSVYTAKGDAFAEVIIDHRSGRIDKVIPIVEGKDLTEARRQAEVMRQADRPLEVATAHALKSQDGYRAVSAVPGRKDGVPLAKIVLTNGREWKTVYEPLQSEGKW